MLTRLGGSTGVKRPVPASSWPLRVRLGQTVGATCDREESMYRKVLGRQPGAQIDAATPLSIGGLLRKRTIFEG
jgi:hypothetical protein